MRMYLLHWFIWLFPTYWISLVVLCLIGLPWEILFWSLGSLLQSFDMDFPFHNSVASALVRATLEAEKVHVSESANAEWAASLYTEIFPASQKDLTPKGGDFTSLPKRKHNRPIKSSPPPEAINLDGPLLLDRISSLQKRALVGRWHFPSMDESQFRSWIMAKWAPLLGYSPTIVRVMNH